MTLVMARYHCNIYPIAFGDFSYVHDLLKDFFIESAPKAPFFLGRASSLSELNLLLRSLPENCCYMVHKDPDDFNSLAVCVIPFSLSTSAIEYLIDNSLIVTDMASRDVRYSDYKRVIFDLPYNYHYIVQRYYE